MAPVRDERATPILDAIGDATSRLEKARRAREEEPT